MPTLTAANQARIENSLSKVWNFSEGVMTMRRQIEEFCTGFTTHEESSVMYNRRKFNNMNYEQQAEYERKLDKKVTKYYATKPDGSIIAIPKMVYELYTEKKNAA